MTIKTNTSEYSHVMWPPLPWTTSLCMPEIATSPLNNTHISVNSPSFWYWNIRSRVPSPPTVQQILRFYASRGYCQEHFPKPLCHRSRLLADTYHELAEGEKQRHELWEASIELRQPAQLNPADLCEKCRRRRPYFIDPPKTMFGWANLPFERCSQGRLGS